MNPKTTTTIPKMTTTCILAFLAVAATLAAMPGAAAPVVVAPTAMDGWQFRHGTCGDPTTGNQTFEEGPGTPPLGTGSLQISVGSNGDSFETFRHSGFNGTLLSDLSSLSYSSYTDVDGAGGGQAIYLILAVSTTGGNTVDDQLFFEPFYQAGQNASIPTQGPILLDTWQSWDALIGGWWSLNGLAGAGPGADVRTLAEYAEAFPNATLVDGTSGSIRLSTGCGSGAWPGFVGNVDNVTIGSTARTVTYDFEATAPTTTTTTSTSTSTTATNTTSSTSTTAPPTNTTTDTSTPPPSTSASTTGSSTDTTTEIPVFPTTAALAIALVAGVGGAFLVMRRRLR